MYVFSIVHFYSHCITDILVLQMKGGSLKAVYFTSVCVKVWLWRKRLKFVASFRTCLAPSQKWLNAISRIWILTESMGNLFISLKFYLKEKLMSICYRMISITHDYTCDFCNFFSQEGDLSVWITCYLQASPRPSWSGGAYYSSIDYSYQLAIFSTLRLPAILSFVFSLGSCPAAWGVGKTHPDLCGISSKCSTEGG